jgi:hypothetical protein
MQIATAEGHRKQTLSYFSVLFRNSPEKMKKEGEIHQTCFATLLRQSE